MMKTTYSRSTFLSGRILVRTKFLLPVLMLLFAASCKKESEVGIDVQPEEDLIGLYTTDTLTLRTSTWIEDSLRTDETPTAVLGTMQDPLFGTTSASVYTQMLIPNNQTNVNFQSDGPAVLDSAVLTIGYKFDFYGDTTIPQTFSVYQMTDMIYKDSMYYSNQTKNFYPQAIGSATFNPAPRSLVNGRAPHVRIPINLSWAQQVFAQGVPGGALEGNADWLAYMNGLYIQPGATGGSLLYFNLPDTLTGLKLYYHSATDTTSFTFTVNSSTAYFSHYDHTFAGPIQSALTLPGEPVTYVQANSGLKTKIEFPFLNDWYNNLGYEAAINKAELVIFGDETQASDNFPLNTRMFLTSIDSIGKEHLIIDMFETSSYYGGTLNTTTNMYRFNIARHIQAILAGEQQNNGLFLKEIFGTENGRRSVIHSGNSTADPSKRMYLRITYTRIN